MPLPGDNRSQADLASDALNALEENTAARDRNSDAMGRQASASDEALEALGAFGKGLKYLKSKSIDPLNYALASVTQTFKTLKSGVDGLRGTFSTWISMGGVLDSMMESAASMGGGGNSWAQAIADLTEKFGNLERGSGKRVLKTFKKLRKAQDGLAESGRSLRSIAGYSRSEQLKLVSEAYESLGGAVDRLGPILDHVAGEWIVMNKAMGLSGEAFQEIAAGKTASEVKQELGEMAKAAVGLGKKYNISAKSIGKNMDAMLKDFKNFGYLSGKEIAATSAYAAKLGMDIKDLQGVMGKFDTWESAAESVGKLNAQFGMQLDTEKMLMTDSVGERMDMIRKNFEQTGRSVDDLSRRQLNYMAELAGVDSKAMKNALSIPVDELGFDEMKKKAKESQKEMTTAEAMKELRKEIKKLHQGGGLNIDKTILGSFIMGMKQGIERSHTFRKVLRQINGVLRLASRSGKKVGKIVMSLFDGYDKKGKDLNAFQKILKSFMNYFDPEYWKKKFTYLTGVVDWAVGILGDPKAWKERTADLKKIPGEIFKAIFGDESGGLSAATGWLSEEFRHGMAEMVSMALTVLSGAVDDIADWLGSPNKGSEGGTKNSLGTMFYEMWLRLEPGLYNLGSSVWKLLPIAFNWAAKKYLNIAKITGDIVDNLFNWDENLVGRGITRLVIKLADYFGVSFQDEMGLSNETLLGDTLLNMISWDDTVSKLEQIWNEKVVPGVTKWMSESGMKFVLGLTESMTSGIAKAGGLLKTLTGGFGKLSEKAHMSYLSKGESMETKAMKEAKKSWEKFSKQHPFKKHLVDEKKFVDDMFKMKLQMLKDNPKQIDGIAKETKGPFAQAINHFFIGISEAVKNLPWKKIWDNVKVGFTALKNLIGDWWDNDGKHLWGKFTSGMMKLFAAGMFKLHSYLDNHWELLKIKMYKGIINMLAGTADTVMNHITSGGYGWLARYLGIPTGKAMSTLGDKAFEADEKRLRAKIAGFKDVAEHAKSEAQNTAYSQAYETQKELTKLRVRFNEADIAGDKELAVLRSEKMGRLQLKLEKEKQAFLDAGGSAKGMMFSDAAAEDAGKRTAQAMAKAMEETSDIEDYFKSIPELGMTSVNAESPAQDMIPVGDAIAQGLSLGVFGDGGSYPGFTQYFSDGWYTVEEELAMIVGNGINKVGHLIQPDSVALGNVITEGLLDGVFGSEDSSGGLTKGFFKQWKHAEKKIIKLVQGTAKNLRSIPLLEIEGKLKKIGNALRVDQQTVVVNTRKMQVSVSMHVTMDSEPLSVAAKEFIVSKDVFLKNPENTIRTSTAGKYRKFHDAYMNYSAGSDWP